MANSFIYKDDVFKIGDTLSISYKIKEGDKERVQVFKGILIKVRGDTLPNRMFTVRKVTRSGVAVERVIPAQSPYINDIKLVKQSDYRKAKAYFLRGLSEQGIRAKLYRTKNKASVAKKTSKTKK